jgi:hypothetical protein
MPVDEEWKIEKRKGTCGACAKAFVPEEEYIAALEDAGPQFVRKEFCPACWAAQHEPGFYSFWKTRTPLKEEGPKRADTEATEETFARLVSEASLEPSRQRLAFLLSLILLQRRRLKLLETVTRNGQEVLRFERAEDRSAVEVVNPGIPDSELNSLKAEMDTLLR